MPIYPAPYAIYGLTDPRERDDIKRVRYVGKGRPLIRYRQELSVARHGGRTHRDNWIRNVLAAGLLPGQRILEWTTVRDGSERETAWIRSLREQGANPTNLTDGGEGTPGHKASTGTRMKMSAARMGNKNALGSKGRLGQHHSEEAKLKMSTAKRGKKLSVEHCGKISASRMGQKNSLGYHHSEGAKLKISAAQMGNKNRLGCKGPLGRHPSFETLAKMSTAKRGKKLPVETKLKMSATHRAYWLRKKAILAQSVV